MTRHLAAVVTVIAVSMAIACGKSDGAAPVPDEIEREPIAYTYELGFWLAIPLGAKLVLRGEVVGTVEPVDGRHTATIQVPEDVYLAGEDKAGGVLAARIDTPCGPFDLPLSVAVDDDEYAPNEHYRSAGQTFTGLTMRPAPSAPSRINVWVDRKGAEGALTIGAMTVVPPPPNPSSGEQDAGAIEGEPEERHTIYNFACEGSRVVAVGGKPIGELPEQLATWPAGRELPKHYKYHLIAMKPGVCYTTTKVNYGVVGDPPSKTALKGKQVYELPGWIDRFMSPAPEEVTIETSDIIALASVRDLVRTRCRRR